MVFSKLVVYALVLFVVAESALGQQDGCFNAIQNLANFDRKLGESPVGEQSRLIQKKNIGKYFSSPGDFSGAAGYLKSNGTGFSCGYSSAWVGEVFNGLKGQYQMYFNGGDGDNTRPNTPAGYVEKIGDDLVAFFKDFGSRDTPMNFYLYHGGNADHVWHIEQLANKRGYRIYQSYNSVYSLKAWLSPVDSLNSLWSDDFFKGDIIPNLKMVPLLNAGVSGALGPNFNATNFPTGVLPPGMEKYLKFWYNQATNKTKILEDLINAKNLYGNGRILSQTEFYSDYLVRLGKLTSWYKDAGSVVGGKDTVVPQDIFDDWTRLYGSPNPTIIGGAPFSQMVKVLSPVNTYFFQIAALPSGQAADCTANAAVLLNSLGQPVAPTTTAPPPATSPPATAPPPATQPPATQPPASPPPATQPPATPPPHCPPCSASSTINLNFGGLLNGVKPK